MPIFFNGRLYVTPAVASKVNDSAMFNPNIGTGNVLALVGTSTGGQPNTELKFGSAAEAAATLVSGDLVDAITRAFSPSSETGSPARVVAIRVNPATQSSLNLLDGGGQTAIALASTDYGLRTAQIKVKVEAATTAGRKLTTQLGNAVYTADNLARNAFSIQYSGGAATATMSVTNSTVTLQVPTGTPFATIDLNVYDTVQKLVDKLNTVTSFSATVLDGNGNAPALNGLDTATAQDVKTSLYTATAHLQAIVDWLNSQAEGLVDATRPAGAGTLPAVMPFSYLTGGSDGTVTNTNWSDAFTTLQTSDVQWVVPLSSNGAIQAMADAHCQFMSNVAQKERRAFVGTALATSDAAALTAAKALNSDRTAMLHVGVYDFNAAGALTLYPPYIAAAMVGGAFSGVDPGVAMTNKSLAIRGLERKLRVPTDTDALILGGVLCLIDDNGFRVAKSNSTWLTDTKFDKVEVSTGAAVDFVARSVRAALAPLKGAPGSPVTLSEAVSRTETALRLLAKPAPIGTGVLVGDKNSPAYKNIVASLSGDAIQVQFQCSPVIPANFVGVTISVVPFSGTASAA